MTKDVIVSIQGLQFAGQQDQDPQAIENIFPGEYHYRNNAHYVIYDEILEGEKKPIKNMIKLRANECAITKKGPVNAQLIFTKGKNTLSNYVTPFGNITMGIDTRQITIDESEDNINLHIDYVLDANYQYVADCQIDIKIRESR